MNLTGDSFLSSFDLKLWMIHQHLLLHHQVYTVFKWQQRDEFEKMIQPILGQMMDRLKKDNSEESNH